MGKVETIQSIYDDFSKGNTTAILDRLSEKVKWEEDAIDHGVPWLKPGRGKLHALEFFKLVGREFEMARFHLRAIVEAGPQVIAMIDLQAMIRSTKKALKDLEIHVWSFDEEGKIRAFRHVVDTHQHVLAAKR